MTDRLKLIYITIEKKESFPKDISYDNHSFIIKEAISDKIEVSKNKYLLTISKEKAQEFHCLEPNLLENLHHINIYTISDPFA